MARPERSRELNAADELEELTRVAELMVHQLREGVPDAYERVYWLRRKLGLVVASLGYNTPSIPRLALYDEEFEIKREYRGAATGPRAHKSHRVSKGAKNDR